MGFGKKFGMDPKKPGTLVIPIIVDRVDQIEVRTDGIKSANSNVLRQLATKKGDYFNRKTFYEVDRRKLMATGRYEDVSFSGFPSGSHRVRLDVALVTEKKGKH